MNDRRQFPRVNIELPVTLRYRGNLIPATALNVSCGGMCLATDNGEVVGDDNVEVVMNLSSKDLDISVRGKIVNITPGARKRVGIQFTNLYSIGHQAVERYIQKKLGNS